MYINNKSFQTFGVLYEKVPMPNFVLTEGKLR